MDDMDRVLAGDPDYVLGYLLDTLRDRAPFENLNDWQVDQQLVISLLATKIFNLELEVAKLKMDSEKLPVTEG